MLESLLGTLIAWFSGDCWTSMEDSCWWVAFSGTITNFPLWWSISVHDSVTIRASMSHLLGSPLSVTQLSRIFAIPTLRHQNLSLKGWSTEQVLYSATTIEDVGNIYEYKMLTCETCLSPNLGYGTNMSLKVLIRWAYVVFFLLELGLGL